MLFHRITSFLVFFLTLGVFALAKPVPGLLDGVTSEVSDITGLFGRQASGDATSVDDVVTSLRSRTDEIMTQIKSLPASGNATSVVPLIRQLTVVLTGASGSLGSIGATPASDSIDALVSEVVAGLVKEIFDVLSGLVGGTSDLSSVDGGLSALTGIDVALAEVLTGLDLVLVGILTLVSSLLSGLLPNLGLLGLPSTLGVLAI